LQIKELQEKLAYVMELVASRQIPPDDFRQTSAGYKNTIGKLEAKLTTFNHDNVDIACLLDQGIGNLLKMDYIYETGDIVY